MKYLKYLFFAVALGLTLLAQLVVPLSAHADGETTPLPTETPTATATPEPLELPTEIPTSTPTYFDSATPELYSATPDFGSHTPTPSATLDMATATATEESTVADVLQELPADTGLVVLDENGQPASLASQEAAEIIATGDPFWCPDSAPIKAAGASPCTPGYATMALLLANQGAYIDGFLEGGTIYISAGVIADLSPIVMDGNNYTNWDSYSLTLQGGWGGMPNSVFTVPITISNWNNKVTVDNITVQNTAGYVTGLTITTSGNVIISDSTFENNYIGAQINETGSGNISIANSNFNMNDFDGLQIFTNYDDQTNTIKIEESHFDDNDRFGWGGYGTWLVGDCDKASISKSTYINNYAGVVSDYPVTESSNTFVYNGINIWAPSDYINCGATPTPTPTTLPAKVEIQTDEAVTLDCSSQSILFRKLSTGDLVEVYCPFNGTVSISRLDSTNLPADLPAGYTYASAFTVDILKDSRNVRVIEEGGYMRASFLASYLQPDKSYAILYWDSWEFKDGQWAPSENGQWITLKDYMFARSFYLDPEETANPMRRQIISGVNLVSNNSGTRIEVKVNFPGIFVLAQY